MQLQSDYNGHTVNKMYRFLILAVLIIAAISSYSYGNSTGVFAFIILGFACEALFWGKIFRKREQH